MINPRYQELFISVQSSTRDDTLEDVVSVELSNGENFVVENQLTYQPSLLTCATTLGIKESGKPDFTVMKLAAPATTVGMFTKNRCPSVTVLRNKACLNSSKTQIIAVNSGNSNVFTPSGEQDLNEVVELISKEFSVPTDMILMCSTGVIGVPLPMDKFRKGIPNLAIKSSHDNLAAAAEAIITTDRYPKSASIKVGEVIISGIAKGAGMIEPNLATMLVYLFTNISIPAKELSDHLEYAVKNSFNAISIDSDTSTSDSVILASTDTLPANSITSSDFRRALTALCLKLARDIVSQGEGVGKILECCVDSETSEEFSRQVAKQIINSPLFKCAMHGGDPNWGRIVMAIGKGWTEDSPLLFTPEMLTIGLQGITVLERGQPIKLDLSALAKRIKDERVIEISVQIGKGGKKARAWGADLTAEYVSINADYTT
jgi:glutamate N-acetyltransferase / amino-acid N-acetyltransferase